MKAKLSIGLLMLLLTAVGCKPTLPKGVLDADDMEDILFDYQLALAMTLDSDAVVQDMYLKAVLRKHDVEQAVFDSSLVYYYRRADHLLDIYRKVAGRIDAEAVKMGASADEFDKFSRISSTGDTADVWGGANSAMLMPWPMFNRMDIAQECDTSYRAGDRFQLRFSSLHVKPALQGGDAVAYLSVTYNKPQPTPHDTLVNRYMHVNSSDFTNELSIDAPTSDATPVRIRGYIYMSDGRQKNGKQEQTNAQQLTQLLFINKIQLIRFHPKHAEQPKDSISAPMPADGPMADDSTGGGTGPTREVDKLLPSEGRVALDSLDNELHRPQRGRNIHVGEIRRD